MGDMSTEAQLALLHKGQETLAERVSEMGASMERVAQALAPVAERLTQYLERHDALDKRVGKVEEAFSARKQETDPVLRWAYKAMGAVALVALIAGMFGDNLQTSMTALASTVRDHETRIVLLEHSAK